jgi:hypothetical protein
MTNEKKLNMCQEKINKKSYYKCFNPDCVDERIWDCGEEDCNKPHICPSCGETASRIALKEVKNYESNKI